MYEGFGAERHAVDHVTVTSQDESEHLAQTGRLLDDQDSFRPETPSARHGGRSRLKAAFTLGRGENRELRVEPEARGEATAVFHCGLQLSGRLSLLRGTRGEADALHGALQITIEQGVFSESEASGEQGDVLIEIMEQIGGCWGRLQVSHRSAR